MQPKKPKYNKQLNEITYISFYVYMLSKSSKVTIENQVREEVVLVWIWNPNFGNKYFVNQM